jgi:hypothetical protein
MRKIEPRLHDVRAEIVTTTFVASGRPEGIHDRGRFLENLNNPSVVKHIELAAPAIRPLYRATSSLHLEAPLLVRRDDIIFATFDGPHYTRGMARPDTFDVPVLLMAPPFQIQGTCAVLQDAEVTQALRFAATGFVVVNEARVFDADGALLGEGETIIVNGAAIQMMSASRQHISVVGAAPTLRREAVGAFDEGRPTQEETTRAA